MIITLEGARKENNEMSNKRTLQNTAGNSHTGGVLIKFLMEEYFLKATGLVYSWIFILTKCVFFLCSIIIFYEENSRRKKVFAYV